MNRASLTSIALLTLVLLAGCTRSAWIGDESIPDETSPASTTPDEPPGGTPAAPEQPEGGWPECFEAARTGADGDRCVFEGGCFGIDECCELAAACEDGVLSQWSSCIDDCTPHPAGDAEGWRDCAEALVGGAQEGDVCFVSGSCERFDDCCEEVVFCFDTIVEVESRCEPDCTGPDTEGETSPVWEFCRQSLDADEAPDTCEIRNAYCEESDGCCVVRVHCDENGYVETFRDCHDPCEGSERWDSCDDYIEGGVPGDSCDEGTFGTCVDRRREGCERHAECVDGRVREARACTG